MIVKEKVVPVLLAAILLVGACNFAMPTPVELPAATYQKNCLQAERALPDGFLSLGAVILRTPGVSYTQALMASDGQMHSIELFNDPLSPLTMRMAISPDGKWFLYNTATEADSWVEHLTVASFDFTEIHEMTWDPRWERGDEVTWANDQTVLIRYTGRQEFLLLNIFRGTTKKVDLSSLPMAPGSLPVYDPELSHFLYFADRPGKDDGVVLWDPGRKQEIWSRQTGSQYLPDTGSWSPDGSRFVVAGPAKAGDPIWELWIVDPKGTLIQNTVLAGTAGPDDLFKKGYSNHYDPKWSLDGRYVSFMLFSGVAVYDTVANQVTNYCIPADASSVVYWSPDSSQIAYNIKSQSGSSDERVVIIDIQENRAVEIPGYFLMGWMSTGQ